MNELVLRGRGLLVAWSMAICVGSAWCAPQDNNATDTVVPASTTEESSDPPLPLASDFSRTTTDKVFSVPVLRAYVRKMDEMHKTQRAQATNRFCFVQQRSGPNDPSRPSHRMIWLEGKRFFHNAYPQQKELAEDQLLSIQFSKSIHMEVDVRNTVEETYGSTFLVDRRWINWMVAQCKRTGRWVTVPPIKKRAG